MPHQSGDHSPHGFRSRAGPGVMIDRDGVPIHPSELQHHAVGLHHPSQAGVLLRAGIYTTHPNSPQVWYGSVNGSSPHRVPGSSLSVTSGESLPDHLQQPTMVGKEVPMDTTIDKQRIIQEALKRHMDDDTSIGKNEADAASALLFATTAMVHSDASSKVSVAESKDDAHDTDGGVTVKEDTESATTKGEEDEENQREKDTGSNVPLKKRRKLMDIMRNKAEDSADDVGNHPLHISPLPSPQVQKGVNRKESSDETVATTSPTKTADSSTCMANSYDMKDAQYLEEGAKIKETSEITTPPIEHFPTVLHRVLANSDLSENNIMQWLPGGKAWKIVRWNALRRFVLPKHFSKRFDTVGRMASSVDAFLWHLTAWGFEEIQSGSDAGAFFHKMFVQDSPDLCQQMTFDPNECDSKLLSGALNKHSSSISDKMLAAIQPHSILQVPSLASRSEAEKYELEKSLRRKEEQVKQRMMHSPTISYPSMPAHRMHYPETPIFLNYHTGDLAYSDGYYFPESPMAMRHVGSALTGYEQRLVQQQQFELGMASRAPLVLHSPHRLVSGRGAMSVPSAGKAGFQATEHHTPVRRSSFPVSTRGKGSRSPACRIPITPGENTGAATKPLQVGPPKEEEEDTARLRKMSEEVAERVAVAVSKKNKRKLPLASAKSNNDEVEEGSKETEPVKTVEQKDFDGTIKSADGKEKSFEDVKSVGV